MIKIYLALCCIVMSSIGYAQQEEAYPTYDSAMKVGRAYLYSYPFSKGLAAYKAAVNLAKTDDQRARAMNGVGDLTLKESFTGTYKTEREAFEKSQKDKTRDIYIEALKLSGAADSTKASIWIAMARNLEAVSVHINGKYLGPKNFYENALALKGITNEQRLHIHNLSATFQDYQQIIKGNFASDDDKAIAIDQIIMTERSPNTRLQYLQEMIDLKNIATFKRVLALFSMAEIYYAQKDIENTKSTLKKIKKIRDVSQDSIIKVDTYLKTVADYEKTEKEKKTK